MYSTETSDIVDVTPVITLSFAILSTVVSLLIFVSLPPELYASVQGVLSKETILFMRFVGVEVAYAICKSGKSSRTISVRYPEVL